jgi:HSP20 family protein
MSLSNHTLGRRTPFKLNLRAGGLPNARPGVKDPGGVAPREGAGQLKCAMSAPKKSYGKQTGTTAMEPLKNLIERAWEGLTDGWRELLTRGGGSLTHFGTEGTRKDELAREFPRWSLLAAESWETALSVVIRLEIPGMNADGLAIDIHGNVLRIRGEKRSGAAQEGRRYHLMERAYGHFERSMTLPHGVDPDKAEVSYHAGVLTVILPKTDTLPPRRLTVSN